MRYHDIYFLVGFIICVLAFLLMVIQTWIERLRLKVERLRLKLEQENTVVMQEISLSMDRRASELFDINKTNKSLIPLFNLTNDKLARWKQELIDGIALKVGEHTVEVSSDFEDAGDVNKVQVTQD